VLLVSRILPSNSRRCESNFAAVIKKSVNAVSIGLANRVRRYNVPRDVKIEFVRVDLGAARQGRKTLTTPANRELNVVRVLTAYELKNERAVWER
jgi:hypothetical protein